MSSEQDFDRFLNENEAAGIFCDMLACGTMPVKLDSILKTCVDTPAETISTLQKEKQEKLLWNKGKEKRLQRLLKFKKNMDQNPSRKRFVHSLAAAIREHLATQELEEHAQLIEKHRRKVDNLHAKRKDAFENKQTS